MSATIPERDLLTQAVVAHLVLSLGTEVAVGRGIAPPEGGWSEGQPGKGFFKPYVVVKTRMARPNPPETIGRDRRIRWIMNYQLSVASKLESMVDSQAHLVRTKFLAFTGIYDLGDGSYEVEQADISTFGATVPNNSTNPPYWDVTDDVSVWLSKVRG